MGLTKALTQYGTMLDKLFFLSDGLPNFSGTHSTSVSNSNENSTDGEAAAVLLEWFPGAFQQHRENGCEFVVTHIGGNGLAGEFMQNLANSVGGTFITR